MSVVPQDPKHPIFGTVSPAHPAAPAGGARVPPGRTTATARLAPNRASAAVGPTTAPADAWVCAMQDDSPEALAVQRRLAGPLPTLDEAVGALDDVDDAILAMQFGTPPPAQGAVQRRRHASAGAPAAAAVHLTRAQLAIAREHNLAWHAKLGYSPSVFGGGSDVASDTFAQQVAARQRHLGLTVDGIAGPKTCAAVGASTAATRTAEVRALATAAGEAPGEAPSAATPTTATARAAEVAALAEAAGEGPSSIAPSADDSTVASRAAQVAALSEDAGEGPSSVAVDAVEATRGTRDAVGAADRALPSAVDEPKEVDESRDTLPVRPVQARASSTRAPSPDDTRAIAARGITGTSGPLPFLAEMKPLFGESGACLDGVRSHVNPVAVQAARAIGADAYATGSDIVFAVEPTRELVGHEAAHIVQQRAGVSLSGGVGAEGDPYEQQADHVGALVARGQSVAHLFAGTGGAVRPAIQRKAKPTQAPTIDMPPMTIGVEASLISEEYGQVADEAEYDQGVQLVQRPPIELRISADGQSAQARRIIEEIESYRLRLVQGIRDGVIPTTVLATNQATVSALGDLLSSSAGQASTLSDFQGQYRQLLLDVARLQGKVEQLTSTNPGLVEAGGLGSERELAQRSKQVASKDAGATHLSSMQTQHEMLALASTQVGQAQNRLREASQYVMGRAAAIAAGVRAATPDPVERGALLAQTDALKGMVSQVIEKGTEHMVLPAQTKVVGAVLDSVIDDIEAGPIRQFEAAVAESAAKSSHAVRAEQVFELRAALAAMRAAAQAYSQATNQLEVVKTQSRVSADLFSNSAELNGDPEVAIVAQLFGEADAAVAQCKVTIDLAIAEDEDATEATKDRTAVKKPEGGPSLLYFEPIRSYSNSTRNFTDPRSIGFTYDAQERHVLIFTDDVLGPTGANATMTKTLANLRSLESTLLTFRSRLQSALGMKRDRKGS
jgi:hypothetical protein